MTTKIPFEPLNYVTQDELDAEPYTLGELASYIEQWAHDRNLIEGSTPEKQFLKLMEEVGETAGAQARGNLDGVKDGIGDAFVVLTILAAQNGLNIADCVAAAWDEIKDRKGRMSNGVFIKEGD